MPIFEEFLILTYKEKNLDIIEYFSLWGNEVPDYLKNLSIICLTQDFDPLQEEESQKKIDDINTKNYLHQFIITDQVGCKRYCTSLVIFEKKDEKCELYYPYVYVIVHVQSNLIQQRQFMTAVYNGVFDRFTRYKDKGWNLMQSKPYNQQLFEFYLSVGLTNLRGIYFVPKQGCQTNRQETINDIIVNNPKRKCNLFNKDVCFKTLFLKLSINSIVKIIQCIILEKQIILFTTQVWDLANITEALLQFIYPLQWRCIYIPYLPSSILDTLHASVPYIIGVHSNQKENVLTQFDCLDKVLVDLDQDRVIGCNLMVHSFPEHLIAYLETQCLKFNKSFMYDDQQLLSLQAVFFRFILQLINNLLPYFIFSDDNYQSIDDIFQKDLYIQMFTQLDQEFYREFVQKTMMFPRLIEDCYKVLYQSDFQKVPLKQQCEVQFYLNLIKLINKSAQGYFDATWRPLNSVESYLKLQVEESTQIDSEGEISVHTLFPKYLKMLDIKEIPSRSFPIGKLEKSRILLLDSKCSVQSQSVSQTKQQLSQIGLEEKLPLYNTGTTLLQDIVQLFNIIYTALPEENAEAQINKSCIFLDKILNDRICGTPHKVSTEQSMYFTEPRNMKFEKASNVNIRASKRIFNIDQSGYQSMYRTKTFNQLRTSKY